MLSLGLWLSEIMLVMEFETLLLQMRVSSKLFASGFLESKGMRTSDEEFRSWHSLARGFLRSEGTLSPSYSKMVGSTI